MRNDAQLERFLVKIIIIIIIFLFNLVFVFLCMEF